jgi:hypothetical protein
MVPGKVIFDLIPRLPGNWQEDPDLVWTVWDHRNWYLWGANTGNIGTDQGESLRGGGMAGPQGPTRGLGHKHYVGLITMDDRHGSTNAAVFTGLKTRIIDGDNVIVPVFVEKDLSPTGAKTSLGTGIGTGMDSQSWINIQFELFRGLVTLGDAASEVVFKEGGVYWPDLSGDAPELHWLKSQEDVVAVRELLRSRANAPEGVYL